MGSIGAIYVYRGLNFGRLEIDGGENYIGGRVRFGTLHVQQTSSFPALSCLLRPFMHWLLRSRGVFKFQDQQDTVKHSIWYYSMLLGILTSCCFLLLPVGGLWSRRAEIPHRRHWHQTTFDCRHPKKLWHLYQDCLLGRSSNEVD
jgi:predicted outer membrane lipoprotein